MLRKRFSRNGQLIKVLMTRDPSEGRESRVGQEVRQEVRQEATTSLLYALFNKIRQLQSEPVALRSVIVPVYQFYKYRTYIET